MRATIQSYLPLLALTVGIFLLSCISGKKKNSSTDELYKVEVMVTQTSSYCGGARPSEEILQELNTLKPASGLTIYIGKGNSNHGVDFVVSSKTDELGKVSVELSEGIYYIVFDNKTAAYKESLLTTYGTETKDYSAIDITCLESWFATPEITFHVQKNNLRTIVLNHHIPCSWSAIPCVNYRGPLPP